jgi:hypothetical protein
MNYFAINLCIILVQVQASTLEHHFPSQSQNTSPQTPNLPTIASFVDFFLVLHTICIQLRNPKFPYKKYGKE